LLVRYSTNPETSAARAPMIEYGYFCVMEYHGVRIKS
jgi:hypothetical protein